MRQHTWHTVRPPEKCTAKTNGAKIDGTNAQCCLDMGVAWTGGVVAVTTLCRVHRTQVVSPPQAVYRSPLCCCGSEALREGNASPTHRHPTATAAGVCEGVECRRLRVPASRRSFAHGASRQDSSHLLPPPVPRCPCHLVTSPEFCLRGAGGGGGGSETQKSKSWCTKNSQINISFCKKSFFPP